MLYRGLVDIARDIDGRATCPHGPQRRRACPGRPDRWVRKIVLPDNIAFLNVEVGSLFCERLIPRWMFGG